MPETSPSRVILVADPGLPIELAGHLRRELPWDVSVTCQRLPINVDGSVRIPADMAIDDGEVAVLLTDHPFRDGLRPVVAQVHPEARTGAVSVPSLGAIRLRDRAIEAVDCVVRELTGDRESRGIGPFRREDREMVRFVSDGRLGRLRILAGMVRANRPWRLLPHLSKAFAAALAVLAAAILNPTIWQLGGSLDVWRMGLAALLAIAAMVIWLVVNHEMWERRDDDDERELVALFNAATVLTLLIGVLLLYAGLLAIGFVADRVIVDGDVMRSITGRPSLLAQHIRLVWLAATIATVAGAVGTGFESDDAVRQAAYGYRQHERLDRDAQRKRRNGHRASP
jgi:hypothetical protein